MRWAPHKKAPFFSAGELKKCNLNLREQGISISNRRNIQFTYSPHNKAVALDCNFIVDSTNGNGFGVRSLNKSGRISSVFMNTSAAITGTVATSAAQITSIAQGTGSLTVGMAVQGTGIPVGTTITGILSSSAVSISQTPTGNHTSESITYQGIAANGLVNPNPAAGYILVTLQDNYNTYLAGNSGFVSPVSGTPILVTTGVTAGGVYVITSLGTTSAAQWALLGVPSYITPAVGVSFCAPLTTTATGTGAIETVVSAGFDHIEVVGDANQMVSNGANVSSGAVGQTIISACFKNTALQAPTNGTVIGMTFLMNDTAQGV